MHSLAQHLSIRAATPQVSKLVKPDTSMAAANCLASFRSLPVLNHDAICKIQSFVGDMTTFSNQLQWAFRREVQMNYAWEFLYNNKITVGLFEDPHSWRQVGPTNIRRFEEGTTRVPWRVPGHYSRSTFDYVLKDIFRFGGEKIFEFHHVSDRWDHFYVRQSPVAAMDVFVFVNTTTAPECSIFKEMVHFTVTTRENTRQRLAGFDLAPDKVICGANLSLEVRNILLAKGIMRLTQSLKMYSPITRLIITPGRHIWNPRWPLPKRRVVMKTSILTHTIKHYLKKVRT